MFALVFVPISLILVGLTFNGVSSLYCYIKRIICAENKVIQQEAIRIRNLLLKNVNKG